MLKSDKYGEYKNNVHLQQVHLNAKYTSLNHNLALWLISEMICIPIAS